MLSPNPQSSLNYWSCCIWCGVWENLFLYCIVLLSLTTLLTSVSVVIPVSIQMFHISKAETGTQVLPWLVVTLLSLGRQNSVSDRHEPTVPVFWAGHVHEGEMRWGATCFAGRRALLCGTWWVWAVFGCSLPSLVNPTGIIQGAQKCWWAYMFLRHLVLQGLGCSKLQFWGL